MKKILSFLLILALLWSMIPGAAAQGAQSNIALSVGSDESQLQLTWHAPGNAGTLLLCEQSSLETGEMPSFHRSFPSTATATEEDGIYSHKVLLTDLEPGTAYAYQLLNGPLTSAIYSFTTAPEGAFSFVFAGDPQLGGSDDLPEDTSGWALALDRIANHEVFSDTAFLLTAGDHVDSKNDESQFDALLDHAPLKHLPMANVIGNHESGSELFPLHFYRPNESGEYGVTDAGGDAWFMYHNVLFLLLNSNDRDTEEHRAFMEAAIAANPEATWRIVAMHHSLYTVASHAYDSKILSRREELVPLFEELNIDAVLMGHDHVYCRSYIMDGLVPLDDPDLYDKRDFSSITNPEGILYITANSSSGSKTYKPKSDVFPYSAAQHQYKTGELSRISITETAFSVETYRTDTMELLDIFTIRKLPETPHPFTDVTEADWYHKAVQYGYTHGTVRGMDDTHFQPELSTTRAMFVTMLYRMMGSPEAEGKLFSDVPKDAWYADAVSWAASEGIVFGTDETHFSPEDPITREQLITMLYRSMPDPQRPDEGESLLSSFSDSRDVSPYALAAIEWGLSQGLILGTGSQLLEPLDHATRAQVAQILMRLDKML